MLAMRIIAVAGTGGGGDKSGPPTHSPSRNAHFSAARKTFAVAVTPSRLAHDEYDILYLHRPIW